MMRYFKDKDGVVFGVDKGQERIIKQDWVECEKPKPKELTDKQKAVNEIRLLESMLTPRALREAGRTGQPVKGYLSGELYCEDVEAEIERLETEVLGR